MVSLTSPLLFVVFILLGFTVFNIVSTEAVSSLKYKPGAYPGPWKGHGCVTSTHTRPARWFDPACKSLNVQPSRSFQIMTLNIVEEAHISRAGF